MTPIINIIAFLVTVLVLVTVHEWGHYIAAKTLGVKVLKFSVGFGKSLWRHTSKKTGTCYTIAWLPLGGYVKLLDEREQVVAPQERHLAFNRQSFWVKTTILLAGPLINLVFAWLVFWIIWMVGVEQIKPIIRNVIPESIAAQSHVPAGGEIVAVDNHPVTSWSHIVIRLMGHIGEKNTVILTIAAPEQHTVNQYTLPLAHWKINDLEPDLLKSLGIVPYTPPLLPIIYKIMPKTPAANSPLRVGDKILAIDELAQQDWQDYAKYIRKHPQETLEINVQRGQQVLKFNIRTDWRFSQFRLIGYLGVEPPPAVWPDNTRYTPQLPVGSAFLRGAQDTWNYTAFNFIALEKLITGKISMRSLGGPVAIFQNASIAFSQGVMIYLGFLAIISVMLACINILPIPGLDGSHILFFIIEAVIRRPISPALQILIFRLGLVALMLLIVHATMNDFMRMLS